MVGPVESMRSLLLCLIILFGVGMQVTSAQTEVSALDWIPAGFEGFLRVDLADPDRTLLELNLAYYAASYIQPLRVNAAQQRRLEDFFPVDFFDVEGVSFQDVILPWLSGELVAAYRAFDDRFRVSLDDLLLILPAKDSFAAAAALSRIVAEQDFAERDSYRGTPIVIGDRTAMAFTPAAVLVGPRPLLEQAIDAQAGERERLIDTEGYAATALEGRAAVHAYIDGEAALRALSVALQGDSSATPLLEAFGDALSAYDGGAFGTALLTGAVDGLSISLGTDTFRNTVNTTIRLKTDVASEAGPVVDDAVLNFIPRSAMLVQSGSSANTAFYNTLLTLPLTGFTANLLGGFVANPAAAQPAIEATPSLPTADDLKAAVDGFLTALETGRNFSVADDLVAHLDGSYAFALIPRPNDPDPLTGARYDMLLVTRVSDAAAALDGASLLAQSVFAVDARAFEDATVGDESFRTLYIEPIGVPLLQLGTVDGMLVVGTGNAVEQAVRAGRGDNRLVNVPRWQNVSRDGQPALYVDLNAVYSTFFGAQSGGAVSQGIGQLGIRVQDLGAGLYQIDATVTLPETL